MEKSFSEMKRDVGMAEGMAVHEERGKHETGEVNNRNNPIPTSLPKDKMFVLLYCSIRKTKWIKK